MADDYSKQGIRTLVDGDASVGVLDDTDTRVDPRDVRALTNADVLTAEQSVPADLNATVTIATDNAGLAKQDTLAAILAALGGGTTDLAVYTVDTLAGNGGTINKDYSPGAATTMLSVVCASTANASYKIGVDQAGGTSFTWHWMGLTSEASPSCQINCDNFALLATAKVRITKTNLDPNAGKSYDVHTTINAQQ